MAFQIKNFASITASIINYMKTGTTKISDYNIGSVARTMIEGPAIEMDELYQKMFIGLKEAIPVAIYQTFEFEKEVAVAASGNIRVTITPDDSATVIPAGTVFRITGGASSYVSQYDVIIASGGSYGDVFVVASTPGTSGNIVALQSFTLSPTIQNVVSATNLAAFANGLPEETEEHRKVRFAEFVKALNHGTVWAIRYGLGLTKIKDSNGNVIESVRYKDVVEPYKTDPEQPISLVNCYIHNGATGASTDLINQAKKIIHGYYEADGTAVPGWKAAGVPVEVYSATVTQVTITGQITIDDGYDEDAVILACSTALSDYISTLDIGKSAIRAKMVGIVMSVDGVLNAVFSAPAADVVATSSGKLMPGVITITPAA